MSEVITEEVKTDIPSPWATEKTEPTIITPVVEEVKDPVIKEKDEHIKEDQPEIVKPDEPEKTPGATPKPIQDRPDEVKTDVKPVEKLESVEPLKFANEESEKVFNLIKEGKTDDVLSILNEQKKLKEADKLPAADIIKLELQYKNKDFSPAEINDLFLEKYEMPEKPEQQSIETDEEFQARLDKYENTVKKIEARIVRDAKPSLTELQKLHKEIVLPDIQKEVSKVAEPTQEELDAQTLAKETFLKSVDDVVSKFNGYNTTFKDEEVELKVSYVPTADEKKELQTIVALAGTNAGEFLQKLGWLDGTGNIVTSKLVEDLPLLLSREKVLSKLVSETGEKRHAASIKAIKNIDYSGKGSNGDIGASNQEKEKSLVHHFFNS